MNQKVQICGRYKKFVDKKLGCGAFKVVYKAIDQDEGIEVAWNEISVTGDLQSLDSLVSEVKLLKDIQHPHILAFYDAWYDEDNLKVVLITERMTGGTIKNFIQKKGPFKLNVVKRWCKQILIGLDYLHSHDPPIVHHDIKADNIFVNSITGIVKIGDLGLCTQLFEGKIKDVVGTLEFLSPESFEGKVSEAVDIWAFGMSVIEIATLEYPYSECKSNFGTVYRKITRGERPLAYYRIEDEELLSFINDCISFKMETRKNAKELLEHPFLTILDSLADARFINLRTDMELEKYLQDLQISGTIPLLKSISSPALSSNKPEPGKGTPKNKPESLNLNLPHKNSSEQFFKEGNPSEPQPQPSHPHPHPHGPPHSPSLSQSSPLSLNLTHL